MSQGRFAARLQADRFPRVSGDEPMRDLMHSIGEMFSPRERG